jgi:hypothetical protein
MSNYFNALFITKDRGFFTVDINRKFTLDYAFEVKRSPRPSIRRLDDIPGCFICHFPHFGIPRLLLSLPRLQVRQQLRT